VKSASVFTAAPRNAPSTMHSNAPQRAQPRVRCRKTGADLPKMGARWLFPSGVGLGQLSDHLVESTYLLGDSLINDGVRDSKPVGDQLHLVEEILEFLVAA
jgi:hypothetical protein